MKGRILSKIIATLILLLSLNAQSIESLTYDELEFMERFDFWYTSTVAGEKCAESFRLYLKTIDNQKAAAMEHFKNAFNESQTNDKYRLGFTSLKIAKANALYKKNKVEEALNILQSITFQNERNTYVKKFRTIMSILEKDIKIKKSKLGIYDDDQQEPVRNEGLMIGLTFNYHNFSSISNKMIIPVAHGEKRSRDVLVEEYEDKEFTPSKLTSLNNYGFFVGYDKHRVSVLLYDGEYTYSWGYSIIAGLSRKYPGLNNKTTIEGMDLGYQYSFLSLGFVDLYSKMHYSSAELMVESYDIEFYWDNSDKYYRDVTDEFKEDITGYGFSIGAEVFFQDIISAQAEIKYSMLNESKALKSKFTSYQFGLNVFVF